MGNTGYRALLQEAQRKRKLTGRAKDEAYNQLKRRLSTVALPGTYEQAIRELCQRLDY